MKLNYKATTISCYIGYVVQAIIVNIAPLLFVCFENSFNISILELTSLITMMFGIQLVIDALATKLVDIIGYRTISLIAHAVSFVGLLSLGILPYIMNNAYVGILISILIASLGSGLIEVVISPIIEAMPGEKNNKAMNFLHSFYCWGYLFTVLVATAFLAIFGSSNWRYLPIALAIIPLLNGMMFIFVPMQNLVETKSERMSIKDLFSSKMFIFLLIMMICSGACEQAICQWAAYFAEKGLHVSKSMGNLLGPCCFAGLMGIARVVAGLYSDKIDQSKILLFSSIACIISYAIVIITSNPIVSLIGCAFCGLAGGAMWPGCLNLSARTYKKGGTTMFAILALGGDLGCTIGPSIVGLVTDSFSDTASGLRVGIAVAIAFPVLLLVSLLIFRKLKSHNATLSNNLQ